MDFSALFSLVLPTGILDYFDIVSHDIGSDRIDLYLDEKVYTLKCDGFEFYKSHGFSREYVLQDFPFRDKSLYLHLRRRRFLDSRTGNTRCRDLEFAFKGTHLTAEFAAFLKGIYR